MSLSPGHPKFHNAKTVAHALVLQMLMSSVARSDLCALTSCAGMIAAATQTMSHTLDTILCFVSGLSRHNSSAAVST